MLNLLQTTVADTKQADRLARLLIKRRLAACVQAIPITSTYRWKGEIEQGEEVLLLMKTSESQTALLKQVLAEEHPYDVPEIIQIHIDEVAPPYAAWAREQTAPDG